MSQTPFRRALREFVGLEKAEGRLDETEKQQDQLRGDVRDMQQRLESLKRIVSTLRHGGERDE